MAGQFQDYLSVFDVGLNGADRALHNQFHSNRCCQVNDHMAAIQQFCRHRHIHDGVNVVVKIRISLEMKEIFNVAGGKIIEGKNLVALCEKIFR